MKITTNVLTTTDKQGLTAKRAQNARKNISAQVVLDAGDAAESHITLTDVKDENGNVVSQKIAVDGDVGGAKYEAGSDYVDVNNEAHTIDLSDSTKEALGKISPSYDEGNGIKIENNTISVDTTVVATKDDLDDKVDKVDNKQLSTEDYTTAEKTKLEGIDKNAQVNKIEGITVAGNTIPPFAKVVEIPVDQIYSGTSVYPQSGAAVAAAIAAALTGIAKSISAGVGIKVDVDPTDSSKYTISVNTSGKASGKYAFVEGDGTSASGYYSHAGGQNTKANKTASRAEGLGTIADGDYQYAGGKYNVPDNQSAEIIGWGTETEPKNIRQLDRNGNETLAGDLIYNKNTSLSNTVIELGADMTGATTTTAGKHGRVPAPPVATEDPKVLTDDAMWTALHEITVDEADKLLGWDTVTDTEEDGENG